MKNNPSSTGFVPVTIQLPAEIAENLRSRNYDFRPLFELLDGESFSPSDIAEALLSVYFAYSQTVLQHTEDIVIGKTDAYERLCDLEQLYRAFSKMEHSAADIPAVPVPVLSDN
ncbi:MAG: hypothetical protein K2G58_05245 [Alistipes sp.]|nr:hypothetical protein [Alistipes sp.]